MTKISLSIAITLSRSRFSPQTADKALGETVVIEGNYRYISVRDVLSYVSKGFGEGRDVVLVLRELELA